MSAASTPPAARVSDAGVEAVHDVVQLDDALTLHGTPAVRLAAHRRVRVRTSSASDALGRSGARLVATLYRWRARLRLDHVRRVELHRGRREPTVSLDDGVATDDLPREVVSTLRRRGFPGGDR